jgi:hypothetical protein
MTETREQGWLKEWNSIKNDLDTVLSSGGMPESVMRILEKTKADYTHRIKQLSEDLKRKEEKKFIEENEPIENIIQWMANAMVTWYGAGGHGKSEANRGITSYWKEILEKRGATIPDDSELSKIGVYNGTGTH